MPSVTISPNSWVAVTTTETDTVFQNRSSREMYITTGIPANSKDGILLLPWQGVVFGVGYEVLVRCNDAEGIVFYSSVSGDENPNKNIFVFVNRKGEVLSFDENKVYIGERQ